MPIFATRSVGEVVSEVLMSRTAFNGCILVVEGDQDIKFWKARVIDERACQFVLAGSKDTVTGALLELNNYGQKGILGVVDDDHDSLLSRSAPSVDIVRTETCDVETLMLGSAAFTKLLNEIGDPQKIRNLETAEGVSIRDAFISRAMIFGQLRYLNKAFRWSVPFDKLSPGRFCDNASWMIDREALLNEFLKFVPGVTKEQLEQYLVSIAMVNPWSVLHGKDSLKVMGIGVRSTVGNAQCSVSLLQQMLRLAFDATMFRQTTLYADVCAWQRNNPNYKIVE